MPSPLATWKIGNPASVGGIVSFHWSVLIPLIAFLLLSGIQGLGIFLLVFSSVYFHEIGHATIARYCGYKCEEINFNGFGGVALLKVKKRLPPLQDFLITAAGPIVSAIIAIIAFMTGAVFVGMINLSLAIFNLFPIFPLDGGRMLRSVLEIFGVSISFSTLFTGILGSAILLGVMIPISIISGEIYLLTTLVFLLLFNFAELSVDKKMQKRVPELEKGLTRLVETFNRVDTRLAAAIAEGRPKEWNCFFDETKLKLATCYAEDVAMLIRTGYWQRLPGPESRLPDEYMPADFFEYWNEKPIAANVV